MRDPCATARFPNRTHAAPITRDSPRGEVDKRAGAQERTRVGAQDRGVPVSGEGSLRTFLGTAPGVGKTYAMLAEGRRRAADGERVVVGWIDWHGRARTASSSVTWR
jgi:Osmosensitive K+ channel His kinase sensor domain